jgi:hypothetical protein
MAGQPLISLHLTIKPGSPLPPRPGLPLPPVSSCGRYLPLPAVAAAVAAPFALPEALACQPKLSGLPLAVPNKAGLAEPHPHFTQRLAEQKGVIDSFSALSDRWKVRCLAAEEQLRQKDHAVQRLTNQNATLKSVESKLSLTRKNLRNAKKKMKENLQEMKEMKVSHKNSVLKETKATKPMAMKAIKAIKAVKAISRRSVNAF